jgi:hypothetical protein
MTTEAAVAPGVTKPVVSRTFVRVAQDLVGLRSFLKFFFRLLVVRILVGMKLDSHLAVCLLDFIGPSILANTQNFVIISLCGHVFLVA